MRVLVVVVGRRRQRQSDEDKVATMTYDDDRYDDRR